MGILLLPLLTISCKQNKLTRNFDLTINAFHNIFSVLAYTKLHIPASPCTTGNSSDIPLIWGGIPCWLYPPDLRDCSIHGLILLWLWLLVLALTSPHFNKYSKCSFNGYLCLSSSLISLWLFSPASVCKSITPVVSAISHTDFHLLCPMLITFMMPRVQILQLFKASIMASSLSMSMQVALYHSNNQLTPLLPEQLAYLYQSKSIQSCAYFVFLSNPTHLLILIINHYHPPSKP